MQIRKIALKNWRSVKKVEMGIHDIIMFVGKNNSGKSNILYSLLFFYDRWKCCEADYFNDAEELFVEVSFAELSPSEKQRWKGFIIDDTLTIRRSAGKNGGSQYSVKKKSGMFEKKSINPADLGEVLFLPAVSSTKNVHKEVTGFDRLLQVVLHQMWIIQRKNDDWLGRFSEKINAEMEEWGVKIELEQQKKNHPEFSAQVFVQNGAASDALQKGKGMERALTFAVFEAVDEFFSHQRSKQNILVLFEEPELFLHPQAQNELFLSLKTLAKSGMQILLTTHSSYFLDLTYHRSICIVRKDSLVQGTKVQQVLSDIFYSESDKKNFNMGYWINPDRGELFFAKKVILAEGPTEKVVLPKLAKKLGISRYEYTVIDCAGKSNMPLYITLLNAFEIPYVAVYDLDYHKHRSKKALLAASRHSGFIDGKIDPAIGESVVFENDIEQELEFRKSRKKQAGAFYIKTSILT
jgi:hypothetical protein